MKSSKALQLIGYSNEKIFTKFYNRNKWGNLESFSGDGSTIKETTKTRKIIENVIKKYKIKSLLDIPCGDFNWMKLINFKMLFFLYSIFLLMLFSFTSILFS